MSGLRAAAGQIGATLRSPLEVLLGIAAAGGLLALAVWLPNLGLLWHLTISGRLSLAGRLHLLWSSLGALATNFTPLQAALTVAVCLLFGLTMAVTGHGLRWRTAGQAGGLGVAGAAVGLLGAGCSACGAVLLSSLLGAGVSAGFVATLPLHGLEFPIASLLLLAAALVLTARSAARPAACAIPRRPEASHQRAATGSASE
ncbi:MAG TPA: hypothetical protein VE776_09970 [Actinomycetota bacterium]|jgi:hypothetical protein|nr:hypothetical protein [Actinomycetota bacterium]